MDDKKILAVLVVFALGIFTALMYFSKKGPLLDKVPATNWTWDNNWNPTAQPKIENKAEVVPTGREVASADEAYKLSGELGMPVCLLFSAGWCNYCQQIKQEIDKPEVRNVLKHYIYAVVDVDKDHLTPSKQGVKNVPEMIITDYTGTKLKSLSGYRTSDQLVVWLGDQSLWTQPKAPPKAEEKPKFEAPQSPPQTPPKEEKPEHRRFRHKS